MRSRIGLPAVALSIGFAAGAASGCASGDSAARPPSPSPRRFNVYPSALDAGSLRSAAVMAPAMVAIYANDEEGGITFDHGLSAQTGGSVNTMMRFTGVPMIDFRRIEATPLIGAEFYNRMDRATTQVTNHCLEGASCTKQAVAYEATVSPKFRTWEQPLAARYVVFLRIAGAYRTPAAIRAPSLTLLAMGGVMGGLIGGIMAASMPRDGAIAAVAVLDLNQGKIVWFKLKPIAQSRSIPDTRSAVAELFSDLF